MQSHVPQRFVIEAGLADRHYWGDLWRYRELFYFLAWRDILIRYKQTAVGILWSLLRPLITMVVFTVLFGRLAKLPAEGVPYPILVFCGLLPWQFFSNAFSESGSSLISNSNLISKVYFPRLVIPAGSVVVGFIDFLISASFLVILMLVYRIVPDWRVLTLPLFVGAAIAASLGAGFLISALTVKYRDFRFIVPFIVQFGLYVSPVGFTSSLVPEHWRLLYSLNPMVGIIDGFRWALLCGQAQIFIPGLILSLLVVLVLFVGGIWYFRRTERSFADIL